MRVSALQLCCTVPVVVFTGGCQSLAERYPDRYGPGPSFEASAVSESVNNQIDVMKAFVRASTAGENIGTTWYAAMEAGFNYVDERCDAYLTTLFRADRDRERLKGFAVLLDKSIGAVLAVSNASKEAITIVAQSFGFAAGATDLITGSYLYQIEPSHIQNLVREMRNAYRAEAFRKQAYFQTSPAAYHGVRGYLNLCLPQTIEGRINELVGRSKSFSDISTPGPSIDLLVTSDPPLARAEAAAVQNIPSPAPVPPRSKPTRPSDPVRPPLSLREDYLATVAQMERDKQALASVIEHSPTPPNEETLRRMAALERSINLARAKIDDLRRRALPGSLD
jgi:hypothetical protein